MPLPAAEQPDQEDPVGPEPPGEPQKGLKTLPSVQLFDRAAGLWIEFEPLTAARTYRIDDPARYVDTSGGFLVRFVDRGKGPAMFSLQVRIEGTAS